MAAEPSATRKEALVVLGMHRSGTSAMARVLALAGAQLPAKLMLPGDGNTIGHWEPLDIQEFNDKVLDALDSDWSDTFGPRQAHQRKLPTRRYVSGARELVRSNYDGGDFIVLKEPRISILMDLWKEALAEEGYTASFIIMVRHPLEVADSLKARNGLVENRSLILWTQYMLSCEVGTRDSKRMFVKFDDLLANPESVLDRMETELGLQFPRRTWQSALEVQEFLRKEERHHRVDGPRTLNNFAELSRLYDFFEAASQGASLNTDIAEETAQWLSRLEMTVGPVLKKAEIELKTARGDADRTREDAASFQRELASLRDDFARRQSDLDERLTRAINDYEEARARAAEAEDAVAKYRRANAEAKVAELEGALSTLRAALDVREAEFIDRFNEASAEIRAANQRAADAMTGSEEVRRRVGELEAEIAVTGLREQALNDHLDQRNAEAEQARQRAEELAVSFAAARERANDLDAAMASIQMRLDHQEIDFAARLADKAADAEDARRAAETLGLAMTDAEAALVQSRLVEEELKRALSEATISASDAIQALSETRAALSETETSLSETTAALSDAKASLSETTTSLFETKASLSETMASLSETTTQLSETKVSLSETAASLSETKASLSETKTSLSEARASINRLDIEMRANTTRAASEIRSVQDQSAELARALSDAVIAREQIDQLSPAELMGRAFRRLFSRSWLG